MYKSWPQGSDLEIRATGAAQIPSCGFLSNLGLKFEQHLDYVPESSMARLGNKARLWAFD